jgi:hypothetical protein
MPLGAPLFFDSEAALQELTKVVAGASCGIRVLPLDLCHPGFHTSRARRMEALLIANVLVIGGVIAVAMFTAE